MSLVPTQNKLYNSITTPSNFDSDVSKFSTKKNCKIIISKNKKFLYEKQGVCIVRVLSLIDNECQLI